VVGSDGTEGLLSAPGVDCSGGVACASLVGCWVKVSRAIAEVDAPDTTANANTAITSCFRGAVMLVLRVMASTAIDLR
jgi:hypothetical protein